MFSNALITVTRKGVTYDQSTGRRTAETAVVILQDAPCSVSQSKAGRVTHSDGIREMTKPSFPVTLETYDDITIETGDQAEITMHDADTTQSYTITDAIFSVGIRQRIWKCDIELIKTPAENAS